MDRRKFLLGISGTAIGGSALLGSGAFSRVESQRAVDIQIAHDRDAYLGLIRNEDSPNASYVDYDEKGHLYIQMDEDNPTDAGGQGVNSNSLTFFDDLFTIRNQGKQPATVCIDTTGLEINGENTGEEPEDNAENVVIFYKGQASGSQGLSGITPIQCPTEENERFAGYCWDHEDLGEPHTHELVVGDELDVGMLVCTKDSSLGENTTISGEARILADAEMEAAQEPEYNTIARIRNGGAGGWQIAAGDVTQTDTMDTSRPGIPAGELLDFELDYEPNGTYTLSVSNDEFSGEVSHEGPTPPSNLFRVTAVGNDADPCDVRNIELNGVDMGDLFDDAEAWPNATTALVDLSDGFEATGQFLFELNETTDERPAIHFQVEDA